jgi:hypothetical protein
LSFSNILVYIYLPVFYNDKTAVEKSKFVKTFNELVEMFGGCSADENTIMGSWKDPITNYVYDDEIRIYHILCPDSESNRDMLKQYKEKLKDRFRQEEILMYYVSVNRF